MTPDEYIRRQVSLARRNQEASDKLRDTGEIHPSLRERGHNAETAKDFHLAVFLHAVTIALLLDELRKAAPGRADQVVEELVGYEDSGDAWHEIVYDWTRLLDVDPASPAPEWVLGVSTDA